MNKPNHPNQEKELPILNSFARWHVAFRIYAAIYERKYQDKGVELRQYEHSIQKAASKYVWDNVANYDKLFRKRMARHHLKHGFPVKSWAIKYHTAWDFELMDKLSKQDPGANGIVLPGNASEQGERRLSNSTNGFTRNKRFVGC